MAQKKVSTRSQAEQEIAFGHVAVNGKIITKSAYPVKQDDIIRLINKNPYVSRAGLKLQSVSKALDVKFRGAVVLDVGSSTGGFTDFALQNGAKKVIAIDVGSDQLHPKLRVDERVELHEKTDIRSIASLSEMPDIVLIDVSFISLRAILPHISSLVSYTTIIVAMAKPQFEAGEKQKSGGVIKNAAIRREILSNLEFWLKTNKFVILKKADSQIAGEKGNLERFYSLKVEKK